MNYTQNYHLPQWVREDRIMMEDFNAMNSSIEAGLTRTAADAASAKQSAQNAENSAASAQLSFANAFSPGNMPYVTGEYMGTGEEITVNLGFRPSFLIIAWDQHTNGSTPSCHLMVTDHALINDRVPFTDTGFIVRAMSTFSSTNPTVNSARARYVYIAFK